MKRLTLIAGLLLAAAGCGGDSERAETPSVTVAIDGVGGIERDGSILIEGRVTPTTATIEVDDRRENVDLDGTFSATVDAPPEGSPASIIVEGHAPGHRPDGAEISIPASEFAASEAPSPPGPSRPEPPSPVTLKVNVYDDTTGNPADEFEIWARGNGSFYPDLAYGSDTRDVLIEDGKLFLYPDGRDGAERSIKLRPPPDLIEGSDKDAILVDVGDAEVTVHGRSIPGGERRFSR